MKKLILVLAMAVSSTALAERNVYKQEFDAHKKAQKALQTCFIDDNQRLQFEQETGYDLSKYSCVKAVRQALGAGIHKTVVYTILVNRTVAEFEVSLFKADNIVSEIIHKAVGDDTNNPTGRESNGAPARAPMPNIRHIPGSTRA